MQTLLTTSPTLLSRAELRREHDDTIGVDDALAYLTRLGLAHRLENHLAFECTVGRRQRLTPTVFSVGDDSPARPTTRGRSGFRIPIAEPGKPARQERLCVASLARGPRRHRSWHAGRPVRALWKAGMVAGAQSGPASADGERRMRRGIMPPAREITKQPQAEKPAPMHAVLSARARSIKACTVGSV